MPLHEEVLKRLWHIVDAGTTISKWTRDCSFDDYVTERKLRHAVERLFMIIGEALREALRVDAQLARSITETKDIIAFRHMLVHGYATVNSEFVWKLIHDDLPLLLTEVRALLGPSPA